jgi:hypothetical protein
VATTCSCTRKIPKKKEPRNSIDFAKKSIFLKASSKKIAAEICGLLVKKKSSTSMKKPEKNIGDSVKN